MITWYAEQFTFEPPSRKCQRKGHDPEFKLVRWEDSTEIYTFVCKRNGCYFHTDFFRKEKH